MNVRSPSIVDDAPAGRDHSTVEVFESPPKRPSTSRRFVDAALLAGRRPAWLSMYLFSRFEFARRARRRWVSGPDLGAMAAHGPSCSVLGAEVPAVVADLRRRGIHTGFALAPEVSEALIEFSRSHVTYANAEISTPIDPSNLRRILDGELRGPVVADYLDQIEGSEVIRGLWADPYLRGIAAEYLGGTPSLVRSRLYWSFASHEAGSSGEGTRALPTLFGQGNMHYDLHDWASMKIFFYLTDVDLDCGPHVYLAGSHRDHRLADQFTIRRSVSQGEIDERYPGLERVVVTGPSGSGFAQDPYGFHCGMGGLTQPRLAFEITFGSSKSSLAGTHNIAV